MPPHRAHHNKCPKKPANKKPQPAQLLMEMNESNNSRLPKWNEKWTAASRATRVAFIQGKVSACLNPRAPMTKEKKERAKLLSAISFGQAKPRAPSMESKVDENQKAEKDVPCEIICCVCSPGDTSMEDTSMDATTL